MGPLQRYQLDLKNKLICTDDAQLLLVEHLQQLYEELYEELYEQILQSQYGKAHAVVRLWKKRLAAITKQPPKPSIQGLYLWGGVGRGKTYLMDIFYECLPGKEKHRTHFHRFMQGVHRDLTTLQGQKNPLELIAAQIAEKTRVLCFDEFFVRDIGDAMILAGLLDALFKHQVILVTTSNIAPDRLYEDGLQRQRFLRAIQLIQQNTKTVEILGGVDYRLRSLTQATLYHCPVTPTTDSLLLECFYELVPDRSKVKQGESIGILDRNIDSRYCTDDVVWFSFEQICEGPRSAFDYVELATMYHAVILDSVPQFREDSNASARRFINLIDELYDRRVKLIISAEVSIPLLYNAEKLGFEFERTKSRLIEMQSQQYLSDQHLA